MKILTLLSSMFLIALVLAGCSQNQPPVSNQTGNAAIATATVLASSAAAVRSPQASGVAGAASSPSPSPTFNAPGTAQTPVGVVQLLLSSLQKDPSGKSSLDYLTPRLRSEVEKGTSLASIIGIQNMYQSFNVSNPTSVVGSPSGSTSQQVPATLEFQSGPQNRLFTVVALNGAWRVDAVSKG